MTNQTRPIKITPVVLVRYRADRAAARTLHAVAPVTRDGAPPVESRRSVDERRTKMRMHTLCIIASAMLAVYLTYFPNPILLVHLAPGLPFGWSWVQERIDEWLGL